MNKTLFVQIFIVLAIVLGYFFIDFNSIYNYFKGETKYITQNSECNLKNNPCEITIQDGTKFTLEVFPKDIPLMKPLKFTLKTNQELKDTTTLNIYATNMFMGYFNLVFQKTGNNEYEAIGTLPTCPIGNMKWNADIEIDKSTEKIGARFQFQTTR